MSAQGLFILGCGYIGQRFAQISKEKGYQLFLSTRRKERISELQSLGNVVLWDKNYPEFLKTVDFLLFSAAPDTSSAYEEAFLNNALLLQKNSDKLPKHILFTSSTSVYGDQEGQTVSEKTPLKPLTPQAKIIAQTEEILLSLPTKISILRLGEIIGPNRLIRDRLQNRDLKKPFPGNGSQIANLIHVDDILRAIEFVWVHELTGIYNLVSPCPPSRKELYEKAAAIFDCPKPEWNPQAFSLHGGNRLINSQKLCSHGFHFSKTKLMDFI